MKEHFCDDARGQRKSNYFLPWHFDFLLRYRPLPSEEYEEPSRDAPLINTRYVPDPDAPPLERLLSRNCPSAAFELIADRLWEAGSDAEAVEALTALASSAQYEGLKAEAAAMAVAKAEDGELSNIPTSGGGAGSGGKRASDRKTRGRRRSQGIQRTEAEIAELRAQRAAKRAATGAPPHVEAGQRSARGSSLRS